MADDQVGIDTVTMAQVYEKQGLWEKAAEIYQKLLQENPHRHDLTEALGRVQAAQETEAMASDKLKPLFLKWVSLNMAVQNRRGLES